MPPTSSISYYNENADAFYARTIHINIADIHKKFLSFLPHPAHILDGGCGVGRDAKAFLSLGHNVVAFDASLEMVKKASELLGYPALHLSFADLSFEGTFDGIWASASLLHVPYEETSDVFYKIHQALKPNGTFYASYKYGNEKMVVEPRTFYNMNEALLSSYLQEFFEIIDMWQTPAQQSDTKPEHNWLNVLARKL